MTVQDWLGSDNTLGIDIWTKKYCHNNETFEHWLDRISNGNKDVKRLISTKKFLFGGRILSNRNIDTNDEHTTYSNCYVISPPEDNIESIYDTCKKLARTYSYGGGCGIDISKLAPTGARVHNQAKSTSGAVSFMDSFSQVTQQIGQNGRRGALMISIDCTHPDLEKFITIKSDLNKVTAANISVKITDDFMNAVEQDADWELYFYRPETNDRISKTVKAKDIFDLLCRNNWDYAEPGILFWDNICNKNLLNNNPEFAYAGTNPCAEEPLPAGGSCLLGSINLAEFVNEDKQFDYQDFDTTIDIAVRALNDVLDDGLPKHPLEEQRNSVRDWRQIGLGIMGLADCLIKMNIRYGSKDAVEFCDNLGKFMANAAIMTSSALAKEKGTSYPKYNDLVLDSNFFKENVDSITEKYVRQNGGLYNSQLLTIAPTGSISTMIGVSGGIEPIFANSYTRMTKSLHGEDVAYKVYTPIVKKYMDENGLTEEEQLPEFFVTSATINVNERVAMQAAWQKHIDASISSTVNLPNEATVDDVKNIYMSAWKNGLKGITVYRSGCAREGILTVGSSKKEDDKKQEQATTEKVIIKKAKNIGLERHLNTGCGSLHVCAYFDESGNLKNTYLSKGSSGGCNNFMIGLSRMISLAARNGVSIDDIIDQLGSSGTCPSYAVRKATKHDTSVGSSCPVAIGYALKDMWMEVNELGAYANTSAPTVEKETVTEKQTKVDNKATNSTDKCPECGNEIRYEGGCVTCPSCGWSKCG